MIVLGINAFHGDSSACLLKDGKVLVALEEERIRRIKHWAGFPSEAIRYCLQDAGIQLSDVDYVAVSRDPSANMLLKIKHVLKNRVGIKALLDRYSNKKKIGSIPDLLMKEFGLSDLKAQVFNIEHHRSHLASAFYVSPFNESALLSIDGFGDFSSTMIGVGKGNDIEVFDKVTFPHSLGVFYTAFTQYLGFPHYGDEYKVMGLAPYGKPVYLDKIRKVIDLQDNGLFKLNLDYFRHHKEGVEMSWADGQPSIGRIFSTAMEDAFGPARKKDEPLEQHHKDLASSVQRMTEETIFHILNNLYKRTGLENICIAGGVAQNSVANGKVLLNTPFKNLYIPPAGHDAGTSIGAALEVYHGSKKMRRTQVMKSASLGSHFNSDDVIKVLNEKGISFQTLKGEAFFEKIVDCITGGGVVGWFQGRAEFGPRALGHRSIIADPRRSDAKDILNLKIKRRESFRPFAPSILKEHVADFFEFSDDVPFMEKVYLIREDKRKLIPAVTHVDGTGRLQTVDIETEPKYHALINSFYRKTGIPILLNTSFNENEPIVNSPVEALDCFLRTQMDMLVMEDIIVTR